VECTLFLPILETFLPLSIALLAMEEEKANKGSSHSSKDAHGNKNIYIDAKMVRFSSGLATDTRDKAIPRFTSGHEVMRYQAGMA